MSVIESREQRRARFLRLAGEAVAAAARTPIPRLRLAFLRIAQHMRTEADRLLSRPAQKSADPGADTLPRVSAALIDGRNRRA